MSAGEALNPGNYLINTPCPVCGTVEEILVAIGSSLSLPLNDMGKVKATMKGKARDHDCRQNRLPVPPAPRLEE